MANEDPLLIAVHWNKTCELWLAADWNRSERSAACRHADRSERRLVRVLR